jgi:uncharacterized protein (TIGR00369 family)
MSDESAYAQLLGIVLENGGDEAVCRMRYSDVVAGLGGLHGGALATLLECAANAELRRGTGGHADCRLVSLTVDYLRAGRPEDAFASAHIIRQGRRFASVRAEAWQAERSQVIATGHAVFALEA